MTEFLVGAVLVLGAWWVVDKNSEIKALLELRYGSGNVTVEDQPYYCAPKCYMHFTRTFDSKIAVYWTDYE